MAHPTPRRLIREACVALPCCVLLSAALAALAPAAGAKTVWLCLPGHQPDPCTPALSTTVYSARLAKLRVEHPQAVKRPAIDCFYVYPTVSDQPTLVANLHIDPVQSEAAAFAAAAAHR